MNLHMNGKGKHFTWHRPHDRSPSHQAFLTLQGPFYPILREMSGMLNFEHQFLSIEANGTSLGDNVPAEKIEDVDECASWFA